MNRRQFLTTPALALPLAIPFPLAAEPTVTYHAYCAWQDELEMRVVSINRGEHVGMVTRYGPKWAWPEKRGALEIEWFTTPDDRSWARSYFPEAFGPMYSK